MTGIWTPSNFNWHTLEGENVSGYVNSATGIIIVVVCPSKEIPGCFSVLEAPHMLAKGIYTSESLAKAAVERGIAGQLSASAPSASKGH